MVPEIATESERVSRVIESLKELALEQNIGVVAVAAADQDGLTARRLHLHHFRGSTALAYEADGVVVLNEKLAVVSRAHAAYAPTRIEEFRSQVVFSVEKNRSGAADIDLEFTKDFTHYRFDPRAPGWPTGCGPRDRSRRDRRPGGPVRRGRLGDRSSYSGPSSTG